MTQKSVAIAASAGSDIDSSTAKSLQRMLAAAGWEVDFVDLDLTGDAPKVDIKICRHDGLWLWARADQLGRCSMETFHRGRALGMAPNQTGRRPSVPLVNDTFLGRQRFEGPRAMLRHMTAYLADNALYPVALADVRSGWAKLMAEPIRLGLNAGAVCQASTETCAPGSP